MRAARAAGPVVRCFCSASEHARRGHPGVARLESLTECWDRYAASRAAVAEDLVALARSVAGPVDTLRVLDVGCGAGAISAAFARHGARVTSMDLEVGRVESTVARVRSEHRSLAGALVGDGCRLPLRPSSFDFIVLMDLIEHVPDPAALLRGVAEAVSPRGWIYVTVPNRHSLVNVINDPHYNVPAVGILPKRWAEWYVIRLLKLRPVYTLEQYFALPEARALIAAAGLEARLLQDEIKGKITQGGPPVSPNRTWMWRLSRVRPVQRLLLRSLDTGLFLRLVQPAWSFLCRRAHWPQDLERTRS